MSGKINRPRKKIGKKRRFNIKNLIKSSKIILTKINENETIID
jgi:hypothetical protein